MGYISSNSAFCVIFGKKRNLTAASLLFEMLRQWNEIVAFEVQCSLKGWFT